MSSLSKLKKGLKSAKGTPPALEAAPGNTAKPPRSETAETVLDHTKMAPGRARAQARVKAQAKQKQEEVIEIIQGTTQVKDSEPQQALQLKVPMSVYNAFCEAAAKEFGYKKGNKTQMFMKLWEDYKE